MEKSVQNSFMPDGTVGRDGNGVSCFMTNIPQIFSVFKAFAERRGSDSGIIFPYELDPIAVYKKKKSFFRPTDIILTCDSIASKKEMLKKADYCICGLYSLFVSCRSFAIDTSLIGTDDISLINERIFFVIPASKARLTEKIASFTVGFRKCGVVTSDGMITFIRNGTPDVTASSLITPTSPLILKVDSPHDFNVGCFDAFSKYLESISAYRFPFFVEQPDYSDRFTYKLGYLAVSSRSLSDTSSYPSSAAYPNSGLFYVSVIPLFGNNLVFPFDNAFSFVNYLKSEACKGRFFAYTAVYGNLADYVNRFRILTDNKTAMPQSDCGYIVIISDTPTAHSQIGVVNV